MASKYTEASKRQRAMVRSYEEHARKDIANMETMVAGRRDGQSSIFSDYNNNGNSAAKEGLATFRGWVYVCVNAIAKRLAGQPILAGTYNAQGDNVSGHALRNLGRIGYKRADDELPTSRGFRIAKSHAEKAARTGQQVEVLDNHPVLDSLDKPNPIQRRWEFLYFLAANMLLTGEAYMVGGIIEGETDDSGDYQGGPAVELWALPTSWIAPDHTNGLFASYKVTFPGQNTAMPVDGANVRRIYFPDPTDPKKAYSPLQAVLSTVRTDDAMTRNQELMFERGLMPNVAITVGKVRNPDGSLQDRRPVLSPQQRRAIVRAVKETWRNTVGQGEPAILDGFIESIHKLQMTPQEMDWINSGKITKDRIFHTFSVNPIVTGETNPSNKAQAVEADKNFCSMAVNPIGDAASDAMTDFYRSVYTADATQAVRLTETQTDAANLCIWIEPCAPIDREQRLAEWSQARAKNDVTRNEFRTEILGLPPLIEDKPRSVLMDTVGGLNGAVTILQARGQGILASEQAEALFQIFYGLEEEDAKRLAAGVHEPDEDYLLIDQDTVIQPLPEDGPPPVIDPTPSNNPTPTPANNPEPEEQAMAMAGEIRKAYEERGSRGISRKDIGPMAAKQGQRIENAVTRELTKFFSGSIADAAKKLAGVPEDAASVPPGGSAERRAAQLARRIFDKDAADEQLYKTMIPYLFWAIAEGALAEKLLAAIGLEKRHPGRIIHKTTAEDALNRYGGELPPGVSLRAPDWLIERAHEAIRETMEQPYWQEINETTRNAIEGLLRDGLENGHSIRRMAQEIETRYGEEYSRARATRVARTECLPGGTTVDAANILAVYRRKYSGPMVEIRTAAGRKFTGTPNHPIMTTRGWVGLGEVTDADKLVCYSSTIEHASTPRYHDVDDGQATIEQLYDAAAAIGVRQRQRTTQPDFHGDGQDGNVDVTLTDGELRHGLFATLHEGREQRGFTEADMRAIALAADSVHPTATRTGTTIDEHYASLFQATTDRGPSNIKADADFEDRFTGTIRGEHSRAIEFADRRTRNAIDQVQTALRGTRTNDNTATRESISHRAGVTSQRRTDSPQAGTGRIELDRILTLHRIEGWNGHVFNLGTADGYFQAQGFYTGNTTGAMNAGHSLAIAETSEQTGLNMGKEWLSVLGTTTRETHAEADGQQTTTPDGMFTVGGYETPEPGHWSLPPEERINCQCTEVSTFTVEDLADYEQQQQDEADSEATTGGGDATDQSDGTPLTDEQAPSDDQQQPDWHLIEEALERLNALPQDESGNYVGAPFEVAPPKEAPKLDDIHEHRNWWMQQPGGLTAIPREDVKLDDVLIQEHQRWQSKRDITLTIADPHRLDGTKTTPRDGWPMDGPVVIRHNGKLYAHREEEHLTGLLLRNEKTASAYVLDMDKWKAELWNDPQRMSRLPMLKIIKEHPDIQRDFEEFKKVFKTPAGKAYIAARKESEALAKTAADLEKELQARRAALHGLGVNEPMQQRAKLATQAKEASDKWQTAMVKQEEHRLLLEQHKAQGLREQVLKKLEATPENIAKGYVPAKDVKVTRSDDYNPNYTSDGQRTQLNNWDKHPQASKRVDEGTAFIRRVTAVQAGQEQGLDMDAHLGADGLRAFHVARNHPTAGAAGIHIAPTDSTGVVVHEIGHRLEARKGANGDEHIGPTRFVEERIKQAKTKDINLREKFGHGYDEGEVGNEDKFGKAFKDHEAAYIGKRYHSGMTEVVSMGVQKLYDDPIHFAENDPEYFKFILGFLRGHIK